MATKKKKENVTESFDSVDALVSSLNKKHGSGTVVTDGEYEPVEFQTTNIMGLDYVLGGGRPKGRIIEVYGQESSGKTGMALHMIGICQRLGEVAAFVDAEHSLDTSYAATHKVDMKKLIFSQPAYGEQALNIVEEMARSKQVNLIVVDSVSALTPKAEVDGEVGDHHVGLQARMMSQGLRKLVPIAKKSNCTIIFINQIRMKIGVMFGCMHASTKLHTLNGLINMRKLVNQEIYQNLVTYDQQKDKFSEDSILTHYYNGIGSKELFVKVKFETCGKQKFGMAIMTKNHKVMTNLGWKEAGNLNAGDLLLSYCETKIDYVIKTKKIKKYIKCLGVCSITKKESKCLGLYDIETNLGNYMVGSSINSKGIVVHNSPETTSGGQALKFYSSIRMEVRKRSYIGDKDNPKGIVQKIKIVKNKVAPPFRTTELNMRFKGGYDAVADMFDNAVNFDVIKKSGAWYSYEDERLGHGDEDSIKNLRNNKDMRKKIKNQLREIFQDYQ